MVLLVFWRIQHDSFLLLLNPIVLGTVGAPQGLTTNVRHPSRSSALLMVSLSFKPVHCRMLYLHRFFCLPLFLIPWTVPRRTVLASPEDFVTCPYHFMVSVFLQWTRVRGIQWLPKSVFAPLHWLYDLCMRCQKDVWNFLCPWSVSFFLFF